jgi:hypothetical protein
MQAMPAKITAMPVMKNGKAELTRREKTSPACSGGTGPDEVTRSIHSRNTDR